MVTHVRAIYGVFVFSYFYGISVTYFVFVLFWAYHDLGDRLSNARCGWSRVIQKHEPSLSIADSSMDLSSCLARYYHHSHQPIPVG